MVHHGTIHLSAKGFCDVHDVTERVQEIVAQSTIHEGIVCVSVVGSTAGVTTMEYEPNLVEDFCDLMERLIPRVLKTRHGATWGDDNGFSHLRASLIGPSATLSLHGGRVQVGTWQQIVVVDFDNRPRTREVTVTVVGE